MPSLDQALSSPLVKALVLGESGAGKTGALVSLVKAGYKLRILDFDNKVADGILPIKIREVAPGNLPLVEFEPLRDKFKSTPIGHVLDGIPTAYTRALALLDKWSDGTAPKDWGGDHFLIIDSLKFCSEAIFNWAQAMSPGTKDPRQWYGTAQKGVEHILDNLTAKWFNTNVLVMCHVDYQARPDGTMKGLPIAIGKALAPDIPTYFDNMILCKVEGTNKRIIQTMATAMIDLKNPASISEPLPIETGLATFVQRLRNGVNPS